MSKLLTNELKTGFLVIICIIILIAFTILVGKFSIFEKHYKVKILFNKVAGLESDATVRLSGVEVGKVEDVKLIQDKEGDTKVLLNLILKEDARLRKGTDASVTTLGLMGEQYIELTPGPSGQAFLESGSTIIGKDPTALDDLVAIGEKIAANVETTLNDISSLTKHLDGLVVDNRQDVDQIMDNLRRTTANFEEFSDDIKRNPWKLLSKGKEKEKRKGRDD